MRSAIEQTAIVSPRSIRRAAERKARKLELKRARSASGGVDGCEALSAISQTQLSPAPDAPSRPRGSTGPTTEQGKNTSRWNSFKHGLYARQLVLPGEDPAELDALRAALRAEHQPATETEEILVNEIAEQFWRLRRMRHFEARGMQPEEFDHWFENGLLALIARQMASAERGMHKAITALRRLQLDRGFVPSKCDQTERSPEIGFVSRNDPESDEAAFLSEPKTQLEFVPSFCGEDLDQLAFEILDHPSFSPPTHENAT
jgi:hypothetical protein